uniref:Glycosyltransferase family 92 protein n=1 Tax=Parascaris univalens TaxID=6257 RepID=A0A915CFE2_PARUN
RKSMAVLYHRRNFAIMLLCSIVGLYIVYVKGNGKLYSEFAISTVKSRSRYPSGMKISVIGDGRKEASMQIRSKRNRSRNIAIVSVLTEDFDESNVIKALSSLRCYALLHGYPLEIVRETPQWRQRCPQADIMFRRHCIISYILPKYEWILVVDADVGVINPTRLIEEFIDDKYDLIFFDRF